jgi:hypothetical protein
VGAIKRPYPLTAFLRWLCLKQIFERVNLAEE